MISWADLRALVDANVLDWQAFRLSDLQYWHRDTARLTLVGFLAISLILLVARGLFLSARAGRHRVLVPAVLSSANTRWASLVRHLPLLLAAAGFPFFAFALADPFTALIANDVSYPGRRISIMIDASSSMQTPFRASGLNKRAETEATFFTTVAAAERFVQLRMKSQYRDLLSLVEFGNRAYVVTPFTSDYSNVLLGISLIGDPVEYSMFPDQGTVITGAIREALELFKAFNFLEASGNLMILFSDGEDTRAIQERVTLDEILKDAVDAKIPVYFVRTNFGRTEGTLITDEGWTRAVERTGGRFFAASDEASLLRAMAEIDRAAVGTISVKQYTSQRPRFATFALIAASCWLAAAGLKLTVPYFQRFP